QVAALPPVQIQGLTSGPSAVARNGLAADAAALAIVLATPLTVPDPGEVAVPASATTGGVPWGVQLEFWSRWLGLLPRMPAPAPSAGQGGTQSSAPRLMVGQPMARLPSDAAPTEPAAADMSNVETTEPMRVSFPWLGVFFGTALAALWIGNRIAPAA